MTEIFPGIHWLKLPLTMIESLPGDVNAYLVEAGSSFLLVDTGWNTPETLASLQKQMTEIGADIRDISQIVVTHVHPDHYGLAGKIKQLSRAKLSLHEIENEFVESRYVKMDSLLTEIGRWVASNGVPSSELADFRDATVGLEQQVVPARPDVTLRGGETIAAGKFNFTVLWTPGHSLGHICLYEHEKRILISGDHILPTITPNVGSHPQSGENPLKKYLDSLNEIKILYIGLVLPGHENPFNNLKTRINELIRHHEERNQEILDKLNGGQKTAYQIAEVLTWGISSDWQHMELFHKRLALFETLAHLTFMAGEGRLKQTSREGVTFYQRN